MSVPAKQFRHLPLVVLAAALLPVAVACLVLFCFDPRRYHFYPTCVFHQATGMLCAGCGSLRALHQLLHGHFASAFRFNPLLIIAMPFAGWLGARWVWCKANDQPASPRFRPMWLWGLLVILIGFTLLRNLPGLPLAMLPP